MGLRLEEQVGGKNTKSATRSAANKLLCGRRLIHAAFIEGKDRGLARHAFRVRALTPRCTSLRSRYFMSFFSRELLSCPNSDMLSMKRTSVSF